MKRKTLSPVELADIYRSYSAAIRIVGHCAEGDLKRKSRIVTYLYEQGNAAWIQLVKLDCPTFGHAFDASRAKAR
jgi:hypothetical protein